MQINENVNTNMFMIYFTNVFEDNHIFLFRCLCSNLVTLRRIIDILMNLNLFHENNMCKKIFKKSEGLQWYIYLFNFGLYVLHIKLLFLPSRFVLAQARV